ncbi:MAG: hypothetical protein CM15mP93_05410 [Thiotrichaceae bacterium]|jgi:hypothetical protein|nr:MAG: hypothetical protein CM15mP93_05410 [Thiotrichaceae bacterium]
MKHYTYRGVPYTTATRRKNNSNNFTYRGVPYTASAANQRINATVSKEEQLAYRGVQYAS